MKSKLDSDQVATSFEFDRVSLAAGVTNVCTLKATGEKDNGENADFGGFFNRIDAWPGRPGVYLGWEDWHNSTVGVDFWFCGRPKHKDVEVYRGVPLQVLDLNTYRIKTIQDGLMLVEGADWR